MHLAVKLRVYCLVTLSGAINSTKVVTLRGAENVLRNVITAGLP